MQEIVIFVEEECNNVVLKVKIIERLEINPIIQLNIEAHT